MNTRMIMVTKGASTVAVSAEVAGDWAYHAGVEVDSKHAFTVTHVPSGLALFKGASREHAAKSVQYLASRGTGHSLPSETVTVAGEYDEWMNGALYSERDWAGLQRAADIAYGVDK